MNALKQPNNRSVLAVPAAITFFGFLDTHLLIPILALYTSEFGASIGIVGLVIGLYSITNTPVPGLLGRGVGYSRHNRGARRSGDNVCYVRLRQPNPEGMGNGFVRHGIGLSVLGASKHI